MLHSVLGRIVRPAILLAAGILVGQGALTIAAPTAPAATTQTRIASCAGFDFHPIDSGTEERWSDRIKYRRSKEGDGWFMCNPNLPHRAVVTKVRFTLKDASDLIDLQYCGLVRIPLTVSGAIQPLAFAVAGTGLVEEPGIKRYGTTAIDFATIDNGAFAYTLQCHIVFAPSLIEIAGAYAGIIGADVTYRISSANG